MADEPRRGVIPLRPLEYPRAGEVLGRAFADDPLWTALMPDPEVRPARLVRMFTALGKATAASGGVAERTPQFEAVALWLSPGGNMGWWALVRSGFALPRFVMKMPRQDRSRLMAVLGQIGERRKQLVPEPHWYLAAVGVDPDRQGRGHGSALVRAGMARADRGAAPIYLETETEGNVGFYEHLGFEVVEEIVATHIDVPLWLMVRGPAAANP